jgi:hypothetical protein
MLDTKHRRAVSTVAIGKHLYFAGDAPKVVRKERRGTERAAVGGGHSRDCLIPLGNAGFLPLDDFAFEPANSLTSFAQDLHWLRKFLCSYQFVNCRAAKSRGGNDTAIRRNF